jgi:enoyl-CoA hydratase/carnithine racemase
MSAGAVRLTIDGPVATVSFDRPEARNALSLAMYDELSAACARIAATPGLRAAQFKGAGGAFVAGTDIAEFRAFAGSADGLAYEARIEQGLVEIEALPVPTLAVIEGAAMGGGLMIATACDLRLASRRARFGAPIAATVGNCLSGRNLRRLERAFGPGPTRRMLLLAERIDAAEAFAAGFLTALVEPEAVATRAAEILDRLVANAPLTIAATRALLRVTDEPDDDIVGRIYASADFHEGVEAFLAKRPPIWRGR